MIKSIIIGGIVALSCPETKLIGFDAPLTEQEIESLNHAKKRCAEIYPESPCLKSFEKREEQVFWAICGGEE
jgi:hypothetical protein